MALKKAFAAQAAKTNEETQRINPEIDAKLTKFIEDNPKLYKYYNDLPKEQLIRKLMLPKMNQRQFSEQRNQDLRQWVEDNPEIKAKVEQRIKNVTPDRKERAFLAIARDEMEQRALQQHNGSNGVKV